MKILTFDLEEWFHLLDHAGTREPGTWQRFPERLHRNTERVLALLEENRLTATFFCLGWVAEKYPSLVRKIDDAGHEIACHSNFHQLVYEQRPDQFREDLAAAIGRIESATGKKVTAYRAPGFSITAEVTWAFAILAEHGITTDSSVFPAGRAHGGFPSFGTARPALLRINGVDLREFPINTASLFGKPFVFSGGGYFRLFPYPVIRRLTLQSTYIMTYFHPRDFDPAQPVLDGLPLHRRFKSYVGLNSAEGKLRRWLSEFQFINLRQAESQTDWLTTPVITL